METLSEFNSAVPEPVISEQETEPNKAVEPTSMAVTFCAPSSTKRASHARGSL